MLVAPSQGSAQVLHSFEDLALRVNLGDHLQIDDRSGVKATGRLTHLTREEIAIQTEAGEKRFTRDTVRAVAIRYRTRQRPSGRETRSCLYSASWSDLKARVCRNCVGPANVLRSQRARRRPVRTRGPAPDCNLWGY
jgi:hypothetical protein